MLTSGPMEGTNNKIKTMKRQAYGFRDQEFFKLKILAIHESRYELVGSIYFAVAPEYARFPRMNLKSFSAIPSESRNQHVRLFSSPARATSG